VADIQKLKTAVRRLYGRQHLHDRCDVMVYDDAKLVRHEDKAFDNHGTWVDVSVYVPDTEVGHAE
jgi:hypothetical protein